MKKFLLVILGVPLAIAVIATALGYEAPEDQGESKESPKTTRPVGPTKVKVPLTTSGPDQTYVAKKVATVRNDEDLNSGVIGIVTVTAKESGVNACTPNEDTQSPEKWCRGGLNVHSFDVMVNLKSGDPVECYENNDIFWESEGGYETVSLPCLFEVKLDDVVSVELLGSTP